MNRTYVIVLAVLMMTMWLVPAGHAADGGVVGTWTFFIKVGGAPPCQCIQIARLNADGTLEGPANDRFSGAAYGEWRRTGEGEVRFALTQNTINADGTGSGVFVVTGSMKLETAGKASGTSTFQVLDVDGKVVASGVATYFATKLVVP